jgi:hypothetical protein
VTLIEKQQLFARLLARLIDQAILMGFEVTMGETWRPDEQAKLYADRGVGIANSLHKKRLAVDLNLFQNGSYLTMSELYKPLGEWWESQSGADFKCCWGGRFSKPDGNHYSIEHEGIR